MRLRGWVWLALLAPAGAQGAVVQVGPFQAYTTINDGIAVAADNDTILISAGTYDEEILLWNRHLILWGAGGAGSVTIRSPGNSGPHVVQVVGGTVDFTGITIDGSVERRGMIVQTNATVTMDDVVFVNGVNADGFPAGGLDIWSASTVTGINLRFDDNIAYAGLRPYGGHIAVEAGSSFDVTGSALFENGGASRGGAIYVDNTSQVSLQDAELANNHATGNGDNDGGALCGEVGSYIQITDSDFHDNSAAPDSNSWGSAIYAGDLDIYDSEFTNNYGAYRGAVAVKSGSLYVTGATFTGNTASQAGGLYCNSTSGCEVDGSLFARNESERGGAFMATVATAILTDNTFCHNEAPAPYAGPTQGDAGAVLAVQATLTGTNNVFFENHANEDGGAVGVFDSTVSMTNNHFVGNTAFQGGAVVLGVGADYTSVANLYGWNTNPLFSGSGAHNSGYNLYFGNGDVNIAGVTDITAQDPLLVAYEPGGLCKPNKLLPTINSPLIDAGPPGFADPDDSPNDIGAFGGPGADPNLFKDSDSDGVIFMFDCDDNDANETGALTFVYIDADSDGYGDYYDTGRLACLDATVSGNNLDCFDNDAASQLGPVWYLDSDGDGMGDFFSPIRDCEQPDGYVADPTDCDDADPAVLGVSPWYIDSDGDGFGDPLTESIRCFASPDEVADGTDCDDNNGEINPDTVWFMDGDGDGLGDDNVMATQCAPPAPNYVLEGGDCDDNLADVGGPTAVFRDDDGDGYGGQSGPAGLRCPSPGFATNDEDCDDTDPAIHPETLWYPDLDGDGLGGEPAVEGCIAPLATLLIGGDCDDSDPDIGGPSTLYEDADGDGWGRADGATILECQSDDYVAEIGDCDDEDGEIYPGAPEFCDDLDSDCDGEFTDVEPENADSVYRDEDGDGYGDPDNSERACPDDDWVKDGTDCDDSDPDSYPGATEIWYDGIDQNCDEMSDFDQDLDGYDAYAHLDEGLDCDDGDDTIHPDAEDLIDDNIDQNCDGVVASTWIVGGVSGCSTVPGSGGWLVMILAALAVRRRN